MTRICLVLVSVVFTWSASAGIISTQFFSSEAEALAAIEAGPFFIGRGDTGEVHIHDEFSPATATELINTVQEGEPQPFRMTYNAAGMAEFKIDNIDADIDPVETPFEEEGFDAILVGVHATLENTALTLHGMSIINLIFQGDTTDAVLTTGETGEAYMLLVTDMDLSNGFVFNGLATFDFPGADPTGEDLYFTAAAVRTPEPTSLLLLGLGVALVALKRH